jgi:hypothetical protein
MSIPEHRVPFCYPQRHKYRAAWTCMCSLQMSFPFWWNQFIKTFVKEVNLRAQLVQDMFYTGLVARPQLWNQGFHPFHLKQVTNTTSCYTQSFPPWYKLLWDHYHNQSTTGHHLTLYITVVSTFLTLKLHFAHKAYLYDSYESHNKQRLFPCTTLTGWSL